MFSPGDAFITQPVDFHSYDDLHRLLGLAVPEQPDSWLPLARQQIRDAGLTVETGISGEDLMRSGTSPPSCTTCAR